jgi:hypothetical protein
VREDPAPWEVRRDSRTPVPPPSPCGPGLGAWSRSRAEGARGCGVGDQPSQEPHPRGHVDVHLPGTLESFPCSATGQVSPSVLGPVAYLASTRSTCPLTLLLGENFLLPSEPRDPLDDRVAESDLRAGTQVEDPGAPSGSSARHGHQAMHTPVFWGSTCPRVTPNPRVLCHAGRGHGLGLECSQGSHLEGFDPVQQCSEAGPQGQDRSPGL